MKANRKHSSKQFASRILLLLFTGCFFVNFSTLATCYYVSEVTNPDNIYLKTTENGAELITDTRTGLMWMKSQLTGIFTWQEALNAAKNSNYAGYTDWRLPSIRELRSLMEECSNNAINTTIFNLYYSGSGGKVWTSTPEANSSEKSWIFDFGGTTGGIGTSTQLRIAKYAVSLVRSGQTLINGIEGVCGSANGTLVTTAPSTNLCLIGTASAVTGTGPWSWTCNANAVGASNATCSAELLDTTPNAFGFVPQNNVPLSSITTSTPITIAGINSAAPIFVTNGFYSIGCTGSYTNVQSTINNNQTVCVRHVSSVNYNTATTTTLTVGGSNGSFTSTTLAQAPVNGVCGAAHGRLTVSAPINTPVTNLCLSGNPSAVQGSGPWTWTCLGIANGESALCSAPLPPEPGSDEDNDGMPYAVEVAEGRNPFAKDNALFAGTNANANRWFAMQQYRDFLAREGDPPGISYWTNVLASGQQDRAQVVRGFFDSAEFQNQYAPLVRLYLSYFGRFPDYQGLINWVAQRKANMSIEAVSQHFAASAEFFSRYGQVTNGDFVTLCYQNVLGRLPDASGYKAWTDALNTGTLTRGQVMLQFAESAEFKATSYNKVAVTMAYVGMMRRSPETAGYNNWLGFLNSGGSVNNLLSGFIGSQEYWNRFLPPQ